MKIVSFCNDQYQNRSDTETILFWLPTFTDNFMIIFLSAFALWENIQREENDYHFCMDMENVGWYIDY